MTSKSILCRILSFALGRSASRSAPGLSVEVPSKLTLLYQRRKLDEEDVRKITSDFLRLIRGPLYIILDALDELPTDRKGIISILLGLSPHIQLFVTTRPLAVDHSHISISLTSSDAHDLRCFVHSEVEALDYSIYGESEDVSALKELVIHKSSGM
jgi:hypothetical protein